MHKIERSRLTFRPSWSASPSARRRTALRQRAAEAMHAYRTHTCGALRLADAGQTARLSGWVHRKRDHGQLLFIDLRDHYGITQCVIDVSSAALRRGRRAAARKRRHGHRQGGRALGRDGQSQAADRRGRAADRRARRSSPRPSRCRSRSTPTPSIPRRCGSNTASSICGASSVHAQHHAALAGHRVDPPAHDRAGLHRVPDADPDRELARGRARLSGAEPAPSRQVLRAAAGAAAVQAAADGGGLRPLFPDRAVLPRRGEPRRPLARRVLSARFRDVVRDPGRRVRRDRAGAGRRVRGIRPGPRRDQAALPAHPLCRGDAALRHRQARPAQPDRDGRRDRDLRAARASSVFAGQIAADANGRASGRSRRRPAATAPSATA